MGIQSEKTPRMTLPSSRIKAVTFPPPPTTVEPDSKEGAKLARMHLNEAPFGPSPRVLTAAAEALTNAHLYPDHNAVELIGRIAVLTGVERSCISVGNGSGEILIAVAQLAIETGDEAVFPAPTFPTCGKGVQIAGGKLIEAPLRDDGVNDVASMLAALTDRTKLFYLCTPNNPTGGVLSAGEIALAADTVPDDCLLVVDEAYHEFANAEGGPDVLSILQRRTGPWVVTRSFSKAYCLAGLRTGYALCSSPDIRDALWALRSNFNLSRPALAAASAAIADTEHLAHVLRQTLAERDRIAQTLQKMGCRLYSGSANFLTFQANGDAMNLATMLGEQGVLVQVLPWPNSKGSIRVTIGSREENDRFLTGIAAARKDIV
jgi:histidinol-phosphate aminotransferase